MSAFLTLLFISLSIISLISPYALASRFSIRSNKNISGQKIVIFISLLLNLPVFILSFLFFKQHGFFCIIYILVTYNLVAYLYFHFFNMSETARRIRIISAIKKGRIKRSEDVSTDYNYDNSLRVRLERLKHLSQIKTSNLENITLTRHFSSMSPEFFSGTEDCLDLIQKTISSKPFTS